MYIYVKIGDLSIAMIDPCDGEKKSKAISSLKAAEKRIMFLVFGLRKKSFAMILCEIRDEHTFFSFLFLVG